MFPAPPTRQQSTQPRGGRPSPRRRASPLLCAAAVLLLSSLLPSAVARAATLEDYRGRVHDALIALDTLAAPGDESGAEDYEADYEANEAAVLKRVRERLPARERVEWGGGTAEVDNSWLYDALDAYGRIRRDDAEERAAALAHMKERLAALEQRLARAEAALSPDAPRRDKEAEKGRLASILRRPEYNRAQSQEGNALKRLFEQIRKWLRELFPRPAPIKPGTTPALSRAAQFFIYGLCLAVVGLLLWKYGPALFRRGWPQRVAPRREPRVVLGEELAPEQTASDLLSEAERLARGGDVRGAIRKAYVALLCELADRRIVRLARHKTNRDYLRDVRRERAALYREMQPLTLNFERHWYGLEAATQDDWADFRARWQRLVAGSQ